MQYSKIHIDSCTKELSVKNFKIRSADPYRQNPAKSWPDPTRPDPIRGSIRSVDNSGLDSPKSSTRSDLKTNPSEQNNIL